MSEKKLIKFSPPDITEKEIECVCDSLSSGWITTGPKTKEFERRIAEYCGANKAVCLNSATACMELMLKILGVGVGDEVITSAYTYTASASVISHVGATIVLCDTKKDSYEMDYEKLGSLITDKTKAIIAVDIAGKICDYLAIYNIVENKKSLYKPINDMQNALGRIAVIADGAHSFGAFREGKVSGQHADFTSFSFHAVKNLTTAEGGAVIWKSGSHIDDEYIYRQFMLHSLHGQTKDALSKTSLGSWEYDIEILGRKCNMTDISAGIGLAQLDRYQSLLSRRHTIAKRYYDELYGADIKILKHEDENYYSSAHLALTRVVGANEKTRNEIIQEMSDMGIATNVHYKPLPMFTAYKKLGFKMEKYPNAFAQYQNAITLPLHTLLTDDEVEYIIDNYKKIVRRHANASFV